MAAAVALTFLAIAIVAMAYAVMWSIFVLLAWAWRRRR